MPLTSQKAEEARQAIEKMGNAAKVIRVVLLVVLLAYCAIWITAFSLLLISATESPESCAQLLLQSIPIGLTAIIGAAALYIMVRSFFDLSKRKSPFTAQQARRFMITAILLLTVVVFEAVASTGVLHFGSLGNAEVLYSLPSEDGNVYIDVKFIIASLICFCLSYVFRYGALLQWLADETL